MKILICGDVVGKAGRKVLEDHLPDIRQRLELDFVIVNGENAAHGFGITDKICAAFYAAGYSERQVLEVILGLAQKVMSNYTNHIAQTPVDRAFAPFVWEPKAAREAS